jgi:hypothetical protein
LSAACPNSVWAAGLQSSSAKGIERGAKSYQGGTSGGGGTIVYSKAEDIKEMLANVYMGAHSYADTPSLVFALSSLEGRWNDVKDPKIKKVFAKLFANLDGTPKNAPESSPAITYVSQLVKPEIQDEPCIDKDGNARAATVVSVSLGKSWPQDWRELAGTMYKVPTDRYSVRICYSINELKKVPKANLYDNVIALSIHELSHVFGYDEKTAVQVQDVLQEKNSRLVDQGIDMVDNLKYLVIGSYVAVREIQEGSDSMSDMQLCMKLGALDSVLLMMTDASNSGLYDILGEKLYLGIRKSVENLESAHYRITDFCEGELAGKRVALKKTISGVDKQVDYLMKVLKID